MLKINTQSACVRDPPTNRLKIGFVCVFAFARSKGAERPRIDSGRFDADTCGKGHALPPNAAKEACRRVMGMVCVSPVEPRPNSGENGAV